MNTFSGITACSDFTSGATFLLKDGFIKIDGGIMKIWNAFKIVFYFIAVLWKKNKKVIIAILSTKWVPTCGAICIVRITMLVYTCVFQPDILLFPCGVDGVPFAMWSL